MDAFLRIVGEWLYLMIDEKENGALVKVGLTSMTLRKRFSGYKTSNPFLICAGVCQVRCNQDLCTVEEMYHQFMENNELFKHITGEWYFITDKELIADIKKNGFEACGKFGKCRNRVKELTKINETIVNLLDPFYEWY